VSDFDDNIDPLDPRFVDAVLARARQRAATPEPAAEVQDTPVAPAPPEVSRTDPPRTESPRAEPPRPEPSGVTMGAAAPTVTPREQPSAGFPSEPVAPKDAVAPTMVATGAFGSDAGEPPDLDDDDDESDGGRRTRNAVEWIAVAIGAVIVAFLIRAFLLQAFYIPSESMEPTLRKNDRILVNKLSYKLHDINRGDLVVFEKPPNEPASDINDLIKRVIARPGETIELHTDGTITIDGQLLNEPYLADGQAPGPMTMERDQFVDGACTNPQPETAKCTLGEGFIFVMGDNRNHSHDSRAFGPIDDDLVVGRAFVKVWPLSGIGFL
jgi:signal peptidase I